MLKLSYDYLMDYPKVLVVDDEPNILRIIKDSLNEKFKVILSNNGSEALKHISNEQIDLILVDQIMPGFNGLEFIKAVRQIPNANVIPIIMLTALKESVDRIEAFKVGVDDFVYKPFSPDELLVRVESRISRFKSLKVRQSNELRLGNLSIDSENYTVKIDNQIIKLTKIEFTILEKLVTDENKLVTRKDLESIIWDKPNEDIRLLDIHMATLRKKTKAFDHKIETIYGKGYVVRSR